MISFKEFFNQYEGVILESSNTARPKLHLTHLEDLVIEEGKVGFDKFKDQILNIIRYIEGLKSNTTLNLKVDGAPALFFGIDPRPEFKNQFFIAMKAAFSKDPKIMHTPEDVQTYYGGRGDLTEKLLNSLQELGKAYKLSGESKIFQGDLLFAAGSDKRVENIDEQQYLTFKPNTIKYAIPVDEKSENYQKASKALVGIFVHDSFTGTAIGQNIKTTPAGKNIDKLIAAAERAGVYIESSTYKSVNLAFNPVEKKMIYTWLSNAEEHISSITQQFDDFYVGSKFMGIVKMFLNNEIKKDPPNVYTKAISKNEDFDEDLFKRTFKHFLKTRFEKEITGKGEKGVSNAKTRFEQYEILLSDENFQSLIITTNYMIKIKGILVNMFNTVESKLGKSFLENPDGSWRVSPGEGFVFFIGDNQIKLVDRLDFSAANLTQGQFQR